MPKNEVVKINVGEVLRARLPRLGRFLPGFLIRKLERLICQDDLNRILEENAGLSGADFCRGALHSLDIKLRIRFAHRMPAHESRVMYVSNHPLGGLDGMALIDLVSRYSGGRRVWFVVNDLLMAVKPLESVFIPVNKHGRQSRENSRMLDDVLAGDDPVIFFPAGLCSRYRTVDFNGKSCRMVCDLEWRKTFVNRCIKYHRDVVPLYFSGENSMDFYHKANLRKRLGIKFNLEMLLLPREMVKAAGKTFTVSVGDIIPWNSLTGGADARDCARAIAYAVYMLSLQEGEATDLPECGSGEGEKQ